MSDEIKSYNNTEKSASTGIKLLVVEVIVIIAFIVGIFVALSYFGIFNVLDLFKSYSPPQAQDVQQDEQKEQSPEQIAKSRDFFPVGLMDSSLRGIQLDYTLEVKIDSNVPLEEGLQRVTFENEDFPAIELSSASYIRKVDGGQVSPEQVANLKPGDTMIWTFYYYPIPKVWTTEENIKLSQFE